MSRQWWSQAILAHAFDMEGDRSFDSPEGDINCFSGCDTARKIGDRGTPIAIRISVNSNQVL